MLILILVDAQHLEDVAFSSKSLLLKLPPANKKFPLRKMYYSFQSLTAH